MWNLHCQETQLFFFPLPAIMLFIAICFTIYLLGNDIKKQILSKEANLLHKNIHYLYHQQRLENNQLECFTWEWLIELLKMYSIGKVILGAWILIHITGKTCSIENLYHFVHQDDVHQWTQVTNQNSSFWIYCVWIWSYSIGSVTFVVEHSLLFSKPPTIGLSPPKR